MGLKMKLWKKLKENHLLIMILCCVLPIAILLGLVYFLGLSRNYLYWGVLLICPATHYFMMKEMHKDKKKKGGCH